MISSTARRCSSSSRRAGPSHSACCRKLQRILRLRPVMMLSRTVMPLKSAMFWKVRAMPSAAARCGSMFAELAVLEADACLAAGGTRRSCTFSIELLPAPLGPMMARTSLLRTSKETSESALHAAEGERDVAHLEQRIAHQAALFSRGRRRRSSHRRILRSAENSAGPPVLVPDLRLDVHRFLRRCTAPRPASAYFSPMKPPAHLARARELAVVGVELLVQDQEAVDLGTGELRLAREVGVHLLDAAGHELVHRVALREIGIAAVGEVALLGPVADTASMSILTNAPTRSRSAPKATASLM